MEPGSTILVTGGAGFIGSRLCSILLDRGFDIRILDNFYRPDHAHLEGLVSRGVEIVEGDVRHPAAVRRALRGASGVAHLAALCINKSLSDPEESVAVNLGGSQNVFSEATAAGVERIVLASSASVYGEPETLPMREDGPVNPQTPYCISKLASEQLLAFYSRQHDTQWNALRYFNVYGPGQQTDAYYTSVVLTFVRRLLQGEPPVIDGRGEQSMDFIHVDDVAAATALALVSEVHGRVFNVGTGISTSIAQLARILIDAVDADVEPVFRPRDVLVSRRAAAIDLARDLLGFEPTVRVEDGLLDLVRETLEAHGAVPA